jgi:CTP synthase
VHVTLVPFIATAGELKTKPTQHSVKEMREIGIQPDMLLCRCDRPSCQGPEGEDRALLQRARRLRHQRGGRGCIYELPSCCTPRGSTTVIAERLNIWSRQPDLGPWQRIVERFTRPANGSTKIGVVGKYVHLKDSYKSPPRGARARRPRPTTCASSSSTSTPSSIEAREQRRASLSGLDAILVPGGFGDRGVEGKIAAIRYARENKVPFFGICLGMQLAVIEFARTSAG